MAAELGYSRQAIENWRTLPKAPQTPSLALWRRFIADHGLGVAGNRVGSQRETLLTETAGENLAILRLRRAREEGAVVAKSDLAAAAKRTIAAAKRELYQVLVSDLPLRLEGKSLAERRAILRAAADRVCDQWSALAAIPALPDEHETVTTP